MAGNAGPKIHRKQKGNPLKYIYPILPQLGPPAGHLGFHKTLQMALNQMLSLRQQFFIMAENEEHTKGREVKKKHSLF